MKGICSEAAQRRFPYIFNYIPNESEKNLLWESPEQILVGFQLKSKEKMKEISYEAAQSRF